MDLKHIAGYLDGRRAYLPPFDEAKLKRMAVWIMLADHLASAFLEQVLAADGRPAMYAISGGVVLDRTIRAFGRQSFPIFCFFLVEGFRKTSSRMRYFLRLLAFAALSQYPFQMSLFPHSSVFHANVIATLAIGFMAVWIIDLIFKICVKTGWPLFSDEKEKPAREPDIEESAALDADGSLIFRKIFAVLLSSAAVYGFARLADALHSDYGRGGVILIVLLFCIWKNRIAALFVSWLWLSWYNSFEIYAAPAFCLLACYNGKRGRQNKYFYYFFYPLHLLILLLVRRFFFGY